MSMSGINAQSIKELRERTQAGMSDCKSALVEAEGDMEKAVEVILKKGLAKSAKRAGAVAAEGEVRASVAADKQSATIVEVNIQTDFAARNDAFKHFVGQVLEVAEKSTHHADLHTQIHPGHGKTVGDIAVELTGKIGEKIQVRRWARVEIPAGKHGLAHAYVHMGGKIGVILALETGTAAAAADPQIATLADDLAMHVAASTTLLVLRRGDIAADEAAKQKDIFSAQLKEDPKTAAKEAQWPKMVEGKLNKWYSEVALLEQESVVTKSDDAGKPLPAEKIEKLLEKAGKALGTTVAIDRFVRFERGEGIARENKDDFAAEVAKMAGG
jgi:elongation factor Ts